MSDKWPIYFEENLIVGNIDSSIGVATLWTPKEAIAKSIDMEKVAVVGQLYSNDGINPMMRNVLAIVNVPTKRAMKPKLRRNVLKKPSPS